LIRRVIDSGISVLGRLGVAGRELEVAAEVAEAEVEGEGGIERLRGGSGGEENEKEGEEKREVYLIKLEMVQWVLCLSSFFEG
jgi:hypothetical protein